MAIENFYDSWENAGFEDIEDAIKTKISDIEGGQFTKLSINIVGSTIKYLTSSAETVTFKYKVDSQVNGEYDPNFNVYLLIGSRTYNITPTSTPTSADIEIETPNLVSWLKLVGGDTISCVIIAEANDTRTSRNIKFNRVTANLTTSNSITTLNPPTDTIYYTAMFSGSLATLLVDFYGTTGSSDSGNKQTVEKTINVGGQVSIGIPSGLQAGAHVVKARLLVGDTESEEVTTSIIVRNNAQPGDAYITTEPIKNAVQNSYINIKYCVYVVDLNQFDNVKVTLQSLNPNSNDWNDVSTIIVSNGTEQIWNYFVPYENNKFKILVKSADNEAVARDTSVILNVIAEASNIGWEEKSNPLFHFSARSHNNNDEHPDNWTSNNYHITFHDMLWDDTGSGWRENYLHLSGKSYCEIANFYPFYNNTQPISGSRGGGLLANGFSLKIRFRVTSVSNPDEKIIECYSEDDKVGFYITGNAIFINFHQKLTSDPRESQAVSQHNSRRFCENTIIDVLITCLPYYDYSGITKHLLCYYINGEIAGFAKLTDTTLSLTNNNKKLLRFGGSGALLDLFDVRFYESYATSFEALLTHTIDLDSATDIRKEFDKNNYYDIDGTGNPILTIAQTIEYGKHLAEQGRTNFAVVVSTDLCNSGAFIGSTSYYNQDDPQSVYIYRFKVNESGRGIINPDLTKWFDGDPGTLRLRRQGTSTADATKGSVRIDTRGTVRVHTWNDEAQTFNAEYTTVGKGATIWQIPDGNAIPCSLLTMKKNPNESTQARNLPTAKMYEDCARYLAATNVEYEDLLTPPQREELAEIATNHPLWTRTELVAAIKTRQCVDGIPSIAFEISRNITDEQKLNPSLIPNSSAPFGGLFDLITDKSNMDVFGFSGDDTFSIEFRNNQSAVCNFHSTNLTDAGTKTPSDGVGNKDLEYRYPDIDTVGGDYEKSATHPEGKASIGLGFDGPIQQFFDFVYNCSPYNIGNKSENGTITSNDNIITVDGVSMEDNESNRLNKFKTELGNYAVVNQMIYNGLMILSGLMVDQDVKNQFWTYFQSASNYDLVNGHKLLRLLGYDFDSGWGMDNDNFFRFLYTVLYEDGLYDGRHDGRSPDFWVLMFRAFKDEMATMNAALHAGGYMRKASVLKYMHDNQVDVYNAMMYNANSEYSYLEGESDYLKAHGSAKEHNEWFVEGRMHFMSGRTFKDMADASDFNGGSAGNDESTNNIAYFNVADYSNLDTANQNYNQKDGNNDHLWEIIVTGYERTYAALRVDNTLQGGNEKAKLIEVTTEYDSNGLPANIIRNRVSIKTDTNYRGQNDTRFRIYGGKHLKTIEGLHRWYISRVNNWGDLVNLEELKLGHYDENDNWYRNPILNSLGVRDGMIFGSCKKLDLAGCTNMTSNVDLRMFPILEEFEGRNMDGTPSITLPSGSSLKVLHLPANLTSIEVVNKPDITTIDFQGSDRLTRVKCVGSSETAALMFIDMLVGDGNILSHVENFEWESGNDTYPVELTSSQINGLLSLSRNESCISDIRGYITTSNGQISRYKSETLKNKYPNLHIVAEEYTEQYSIELTSYNMYEGGSIQIIANNISLDVLKFRLTHNVTGQITEASARQRITLEDGIISCTEPDDNSSWSDNIAIDVCPTWSDFDALDVQHLTLTVEAVNLSEIVLSNPTEVGKNTRTTINVIPVPANCTKLGGLTLHPAASAGTVNVNGMNVSFQSPATTGSVTVQVSAHIYGDQVDTETVTIDVVEPSIKAIVLVDGSPGTTEYIAITETSIGEQHLVNGGVLSNVNIGTSYALSAPTKDGYNSDVGYYDAQNNKVPANSVTAINGVITVYLEYTTKQPDVYVVYSETDENGKNYYETIEEFDERGGTPYILDGNALNLEGICINLGIASALPFAYSVNNPFVETAASSVSRPIYAGNYDDPLPDLDSYGGRDKVPYGNGNFIYTILSNYAWPCSGNVKAYTADTGEIISFFNNIGRASAAFYSYGIGTPNRGVNSVFIPYGFSKSGNFIRIIRSNNSITSVDVVNRNMLLVLYTWNPRLHGTELS